VEERAACMFILNLKTSDCSKLGIYLQNCTASYSRIPIFTLQKPKISRDYAVIDPKISTELEYTVLHNYVYCTGYTIMFILQATRHL